MSIRPQFRGKVRLFLRSFSLQGSWSFRHMQGLGFFYVLSPWLQRVHGNNPRNIHRRHMAFFNTNPYMANYLMGVVARLEVDGQPERIQVAKNALMGPLGATGDGLFWATLRPLSVLLALCVAFISPFIGVLTVLIVYNAITITTRWKLLGKGYENASEPLGYIADRGDRSTIRRLTLAFGPLLGFLLGGVAVRTGVPGTVLALFILALGLTLRKQRTWPALCASLAVVVLLGLLGLRMEIPWFPVK